MSKSPLPLVVGLLLLGLPAPAQTTNAAPVKTEPPAPAAVPDGPILTPPAPHTPAIHGPKVLGVRPGSPFLYTIPATGDRPLQFSVEPLPPGLKVNAATGQITGKLTKAGPIDVELVATNSLGTSRKKFRIVVGDDIALTPPMGWNSWNCWHGSIDQEKILQAAQGMASSGLINHGWTYVNIDDCWQGKRGGEFNAIQPDPKNFPNIKDLSDQVHALGLKLGIYSTPWVTSYGRHIGGSSENEKGDWDHDTMTKGALNKKILPFDIGKYRFFTQDAKQWAEWNIDYLKFDWGPVEIPETVEMESALKASGRDVVYSLSNNGAGNIFSEIADLSGHANAWRTGNDIIDTWPSLKGHAFTNDKWAPFNRPSHYNDPDMFEIGTNGGGKPKRLNADEQYLHVSMWCLLSAPLLLGCDLQHLDPFTLNLVTNDEVLDVDQDTLCKQAVRVGEAKGDLIVYAKPLDDGTWAVGLFNITDTPATVSVKWTDLAGVTGPQRVRDLWRQKILGTFPEGFSSQVNAHGVVLVKVAPAAK